MSTQFFPITICIVMLSLGMSLTVDDFRRAASLRLPLAAALFCQLVILPAICVGVCLLFELPPALAVGMMLMAAMPGGAVANVFSHIVNGDLALNLTLTAVNAVLSIVTLPLILGVGMAVFMSDGQTIPPQFGKFLQVLAIVVVPVLLGMALRSRYPRVEQRLRRPMKILAALVIVAAGAIAVITGWDTMVNHAAALGGAVLSFNFISLLVGYVVPRAMHLRPRQAIAISIEIGMHNAALAVSIALSPQLLNNADMAVPAALYGVTTLFMAAGFVFAVKKLDPAKDW